MHTHCPAFLQLPMPLDKLTSALFFHSNINLYINSPHPRLANYSPQKAGLRLKMSAANLPKFIYKILPAAPQDPLPEQFPFSQLDANDGFVHLSTATQVNNTMNSSCYQVLLCG